MSLVVYKRIGSTDEVQFRFARDQPVRVIVGGTSFGKSTSLLSPPIILHKGSSWGKSECNLDLLRAIAGRERFRDLLSRPSRADQWEART